MKGKASYLYYIMTETLSALRSNPVTSALTTLTLGVSLAALSFFVFLFVNLNAVVRTWGERTHIVAYVKDVTLTAEAAKAHRLELQKVLGVKAVEFVSKESALKDLKAALKGHEAVLEGVDANPLPASFEIKLHEEYRTPVMVGTVIGKLKRLSWIDELQYSQEWLDKFSSFIRFIETTALIIGVFLALAAVFIVSNTIRLAVYARKDDIEVMRLSGASWSYVSAPFIIEGALHGFFGGIIALCVQYVLKYVMFVNIPQYFDFIIKGPYPLPVMSAAVITAGIILGLTGSLVSMIRFMKA